MTTEERAIRVLIADDHVLVRKGLCVLLETESDIDVVGEAGNGQEALAQTELLHPDVILMDLMMPGMDGTEATREISARWPETRILVLTSFGGDDKVFPAIKAGALGYLLKDSGPEDVVRSIHEVYRGESSLHPSIARKVLRELNAPTGRAKAADVLTERELEVLRLLASGLSNQEIAGKLVITDATTRAHVSNILGKLQVASRIQAALYALREGLAPLEGVRPEE
jgi:two-component system, NarL family, response regulator LiaR